MIIRGELHPDDRAARYAVRDRLRAARKSQGRTAQDVADQLGLCTDSVRCLELRAPSWGARRVQAWARALGHEFRMTVTGLAVPDDGDLRAELLAVATPFGDVDVDRLHLLTVANDLVRIRRASGLSFRQFGHLMGVTDQAVRGWEDLPQGSQVRTVQRYCRALGGVLILGVVPAVAGVRS